MTWVTAPVAATLRGVSESAILKAVKQNKYVYRYVDGIGRGGKQLQIALESLPQDAQDRYHGKQQEVQRDILLSLTDAQRDAAFEKESIVTDYQDLKNCNNKLNTF